jgi:hypothetical protein
MSSHQSDLDRLAELSIADVLGDLSDEEQREYAELQMRHPDFDKSSSERIAAAALSAVVRDGDPIPDNVAAAIVNEGERYLSQTGFMRFVGLHANAPSKEQYQLWIFDAERDQRYPVDGGVFDVSSDGEVVVPIKARLHVSSATLFAVTVEKPGGVVVSSRERMAALAKIS